MLTVWKAAKISFQPLLFLADILPFFSWKS